MREFGLAFSAASAVVFLVLASTCHAVVRTETVSYKAGDATLKGFLAWDDAVAGKRPGVLAAPEWWGLNDYAKMRAEKLAGLGYIALVLDIYGDGRTTTDPEEAAKLSGVFRQDRALWRARAKAALDTLTKQPQVDPKRIAAVGYCFGGTTVLELAYGGADIAGVVTFHAGLTAPTPGDIKGIKAKFLILHGADDTFETPEQVTEFQNAMRSAGLDWQMVYFGGAVHSFTNPGADGFHMKGIAYNEKADRRSWEYMKTFLAETLAA